ncbi:MAG: polyribonucleotide nucleotidyltransferase [Nitrospirae bacterium GWD2_57_9]|nr:MAG: polyribonucleotide nucleotidyltransferase [Nitrospirae bacterium GWD2_57_9]OGW50285.1 MAG: polyribonucleotide nucleotidyltransferase [Nitrospirae bacterium GWC2_57_9]
MATTVETEVGGRRLILETGLMAKQASGAVVARYGDTVVLSTAVASKVERENVDFLPLTVDYQEKAYAAGRIPGGFFKREGRQSEKEILSSRLIDRPLRPLFPDGYYFDTQIIASVLSIGDESSMDLMGMIASSAALAISDIPFNGPIGAVRVGYQDGKFVVNPGHKELETTKLNLVVAGTHDAIMMVEGGASELTEDQMLEALETAHREIKKIVALQKELMAKVGKPKRVVKVVEIDQVLAKQVAELAMDRLKDAIVIPNKMERQKTLDALLADIKEKLKNEDPTRSRQVSTIFLNLEKDEVRKIILEKNIRADGRKPDQIRPISSVVGMLPRTHGSALFTRGETQALVVATLGTSEDEQRIDSLEGEYFKTFMLHYNFPPFSVGETKPLRGPGRREVGHGALAERALKAMVPTKQEFPYTIRIVSDILESNGSSSMATVCGGTLALMDAGVPIKSPVAGIAMGLIKEGDKVIVLSDILGLEDHLGDMDFKVTGTSQGITALQMDMKIEGITIEVMRTALQQAKEGRLHILGKMLETLSSPRKNLNPFAPRIITMQINPDKIKDVIGSGGKVIRSIVEQTGAKIDIEDSGVINIASSDEAAANKAKEIIRGIVQEAEVGKLYMGKVRKIMDFGAFVEIFPGTDGLLHISQISEKRLEKVTDELKEGDEVLVKVLEIDRQGKIRLSRKEAMREKSKT